MTRRSLIWSPLFLATRRVWGALWNAIPLPATQKGDSASANPGNTSSTVLDNGNHRLEFDLQTAQLKSLRATGAADQEFVPSGDEHPVFVIQYLDNNKFFRQIASTEAKRVSVQRAEEAGVGGRKETVITASFHDLSGLNLAATVTVRTVADDPLSYWSISIGNHAGLSITDVQFPIIVASYHLAGTAGSEALLQPFIAGQLLKAPQPQDLEPDSPHAWQFRPENQDSWHYPGITFAQFLAYYNDRAGIYVSCQDSSGAIKLIKPVHSKTGIRLGMAHVGDWPVQGERRLEYDVVLRTFTGDWYQAAELYREWSLRQPWAQKPLHTRNDMPTWLLDSPPHIIVRIQGQLDAGPTDPNPEFLPYPKIIPLLEKVAGRIGSPVVAVIMAWERPGPWVYPDCFPPAGGDQSIKEFTQLARDRGWHVGSFCNGTRWVTGQFWSGYDGEKYFAKQGGEKSVCRTHEQEFWKESWDRTWRPSYACCLGVPLTREIALSFVQRLIEDGLDWVQFLDQNVGCSTFPCYAADHGHPPAPGKWMTAGMQALQDAFHKLARDTEEASQGKRRLAFSVEMPPNEYFMPNFQICDVRLTPPGHPGSLGKPGAFVPLFHFLYHEFVLIQGAFGFAPEPYHLPIQNAYNLVVGEIPGGVITGDGRLLNRDTINWAPWDPPVGDNEDSLKMLRSTTALRRGKAKDFLIYGRMQPPANVTGTKTIRWQNNGLDHQIPAVFHSAWRSPEGRFGIVLSNWTTETQAVTFADSRLGRGFTESISSEEVTSRARQAGRRGQLAVSLPPLSCALLEAL